MLHSLKVFDTVDRDKVWEMLHNLETPLKAVKMIIAFYSCVQCCVRWGAKLSEFFKCHLGVKQGCLLGPLIVSLLISEVVNFIRKDRKHGIQWISGQDKIFLLLSADNIALTSSTSAGLQNQINSLEKVSSSSSLIVDLEKTKVMELRKDGHIAATEKWFYTSTEIEIVNSYIYLGYTLATKLSSHVACREYIDKTKEKSFTLWKPCGHVGASIFLFCLDCLIVK